MSAANHGSIKLTRCGGLFGGGLRSRLGCGRLRDSRVPSADRRSDSDGIVGLRLGDEGLDCELGCGQRLRVETFGDVVALEGCVCIALGRGEAEPFEGLREVLFDADASRIEDAEIELAVGDAAVGRFAEPLRRTLVVCALAAAV